ncbi:MAG: hypothetical protein FJY88_02385 [Candidatus Eisenbacteria bacterium]|nr:hypothetical protein [Candidatus Eisenbacteria bacterium]
MESCAWAAEFPAAITVCDRDGIIVAMNEGSVATFEADGGRGLVGRNLLDCHPERARSKLRALLAAGGTNTYTIERGKVRKLIHQAPWYRGGEVAGLVEISFVIPETLPHFVRDAAP